MLAKSDVETILAIEGEWLPHVEVVDRVCKKSALGLKLIGFAVPLLRSAKVQQVMDPVSTSWRVRTLLMARRSQG